MTPSTCLSDLVLALTCLAVGIWLGRQADPVRRLGAVGMVLTAVPAALGAVRYGGVSSLAPVHVGASHLAGAVGPGCFALVAASVSLVRGSPRERVVQVGLLALVAGWVVFELSWPLALYRTLVGALAVVIMLVVAARARTRAGAALGAGALGLALAGLVIGTQGDLGPFLAIDVFHLVLALAHTLVGYGLVHLAGTEPGPGPGPGPGPSG